MTVRVEGMPHHVMSKCFAPAQGADVRGWVQDTGFCVRVIRWLLNVM